jgi:hypothetical protein
MNSLNTDSWSSSLDSAVIADRSRTVSLTRILAEQRTASAIASDGRQSTSISRSAICTKTLPWKTPPPASSATRSLTTTRVISAPIFVSRSTMRSCVRGRSLVMPAIRVAML